MKFNHYALMRLMIITPSVMLIGAAVGVIFALLLGDIQLAPNIAGGLGAIFAVIAFNLNQRYYGPIFLDNKADDEDALY